MFCFWTTQRLHSFFLLPTDNFQLAYHFQVGFKPQTQGSRAVCFPAGVAVYLTFIYIVL